jgi:hypothetical protein
MTYKILLLAVASMHAVACIPFGAATVPTSTFEPGKPDTPCVAQVLKDPQEGTVVAMVGCKANVLAQCKAGDGDLASELEGSCVGATHVARGGKLVPLTLGDYRITGTYRGLMRQPHGPYESYDVTLWLAQDGKTVTGVTRISTLDDKYYGDIRIEGRVEGNVIYLADVELLDENLPFYLEWCSKSGYVIVDPRTGSLIGPWRAPNGCYPGSLDAKRVEDHPRVLLPRRRAASR